MKDIDVLDRYLVSKSMEMVKGKTLFVGVNDGILVIKNYISEDGYEKTTISFKELDGQLDINLKNLVITKPKRSSH